MTPMGLRVRDVPWLIVRSWLMSVSETLRRLASS